MSEKFASAMIRQQFGGGIDGGVCGGLIADRARCFQQVRAVDLFVEGLDPGKLGFQKVQPLDDGRPAVSASPSTAGTRFAARKSTNVLSLGERCRLDGHRTRRGPERSV